MHTDMEGQAPGVFSPITTAAACDASPRFRFRQLSLIWMAMLSLVGGSALAQTGYAWWSNYNGTYSATASYTRAYCWNQFTGARWPLVRK
jgi:hypothetical protein